MPLNPHRSTNNFRLQTIIAAEIAEAEALLKEKPEAMLTDKELVDLALTYLEIGDWARVERFATRALTFETLGNELKAGSFYALATMKRERNLCDEALLDCESALTLAESTWVKSNLLRHKGLVYLKQQQFDAAYRCFCDAFTLVEASVEDDLKGSLPALKNYSALALARAALASGGDLAPSLALFEQTKRLYDVYFSQEGIVEESLRRGSHDYVSHLFHGAMICCETSEKNPSEDHGSRLEQAKLALTDVLRSREENKADGVRLGDAHTWFGRVCVGLNQVPEAKQAFLTALTYYKTVFSADAPQIGDVTRRLTHLTFEQTSAATLVEFGALRVNTGSTTSAPQALPDPIKKPNF